MRYALMKMLIYRDGLFVFDAYEIMYYHRHFVNAFISIFLYIIKPSISNYLLMLHLILPSIFLYYFVYKQCRPTYARVSINLNRRSSFKATFREHQTWLHGETLRCSESWVKRMDRKGITLMNIIVKYKNAPIKLHVWCQNNIASHHHFFTQMPCTLASYAF